jgi:hypothetical protein
VQVGGGGCRLAPATVQRKVVAANTDGGGVAWKVVNGTSPARVVMLMIERKREEEERACEKILEGCLGAPAAWRFASALGVSCSTFA